MINYGAKYFNEVQKTLLLIGDFNSKLEKWSHNTIIFILVHAAFCKFKLSLRKASRYFIKIINIGLGDYLLKCELLMSSILFIS